MKIKYINIMKYFPADKTIKTIKFTGKYMELETTILGEVTQIRKTNVVSFLSFCGY